MTTLYLIRFFAKPAIGLLCRNRMNYGDRVQESVFECILDKNLLDKMTKQIYEIVRQDDDSVRIYTLCANCEKNISIMGIGEVTRDEEVYII